MLQEPLTLYKLIVLYMLDHVTFSLTNAQISDFVLDKGYTNSLTLQQTIHDLTDAGMLSPNTLRNRTYLTITEEGRETLHFFQNRISHAIQTDIDTYLQENNFSLRNDVSVQSIYYKSTSGEYEARLIARERDITLINLTLSVPTEDIAASICDNWENKNQEIYEYLVSELF